MRLTPDLLAEWLDSAFRIKPAARPLPELKLDLPAFLEDAALRPEGLYVMDATSPLPHPEASACIVDCRGGAVQEELPVGCVLACAEAEDARAVMNCLQDCYRFYGNWTERMRIAETGPFAKLINICSEPFDNLFLVADMDFVPLAISHRGKEKALDAVERENNVLLAVDEAEMRLMKDGFHAHRILTEPYESMSIARRDGVRRPLMVLNLFDGRNANMGYLVTVATEQPITPRDGHLLAMAAPYVQRALLSQPKESSSEMDYLRRAVETMFDGKQLSADMVSQAETAAGLAGMRKRCFVIYLPTNATDEFARYCSRTLSLALGPCLTLQRGGELIVITEATAESPESEEAGQTLEALLERLGIFAGASDTFTSMVDFLEYYEEAHCAGLFVREKPRDTRIHHFARYRLDYLLSSYASTAPRAAFVPEELERVIAYNETASVDYPETLLVFFEEGGNTASCARRLGISRNTLLPRLERLKALLDNDLSDPRYRFMLELCLRIRSEHGER